MMMMDIIINGEPTEQAVKEGWHDNMYNIIPGLRWYRLYAEYFNAICL